MPPLPRLTILFALLVSLVGCDGDDAYVGSSSSGSVSTDAGPREVRMTALSVTPTDLALAAGTTSALRATAAFSDGTNKDVTAAAVWTSSSDAIATAAKGTLTAHAVGTATLTAKNGSFSATVRVEVTAATLRSLAITPPAPSLAKGTSVPLAATGTFSDATVQDLTTQVTWTSSAPDAAAIDAIGVVKAATPGAATITARLGDVTTTAEVVVTDAALVSIDVTPAATTLAKGFTRQLVATGTYTDSTTQDLTAQASWTSSDPAIASISDEAATRGLATAAAPGEAVLTATVGNVAGSTPLTVSVASLVSLAITPPAPSVAKGFTQQLTATGTFSDLTTQDLTSQVTWSSGTPATASIASTGLATTLLEGTSTLTATLGDVTTDTVLTVTAAVLVSIEVTPSAPTLAKGLTQQFQATGITSDRSTLDLTAQVTWSSSDPVVSISNAAGSLGLASTVAEGAATISASLDDVVGNTILTVSPAELVAIAVTPASPSLAKGRTQQLTATGTYTDATTLDLTAQVTWSSSAVASAVVSNAAGTHGLSTALAEGAAVMSATQGAIVGSTTLTVTAAVLDSIAIAPLEPSVAAGRTQQFSATGTYSDGTTQNVTTQVTWQSAVVARATISNANGSRGLATSVSLGDATITATLGAVQGTTVLHVTAAELVSIALTPAAPSLFAGSTTQLTATGTYTDGTTLNLTAQVLWQSASPAFATVSNAVGSKGLATGVAAGTSVVSATLGGITGSTTATTSLYRPECGSAEVIDDPTRAVSNVGGAVTCDASVFPTPRWIRFEGTAGTRIPTTVPERYSCGTHATGWVNGVYPTETSTSTVEVCYNWAGDSCWQRNDIQITACDGYHVFLLSRPTACSLRYCVE